MRGWHVFFLIKPSSSTFSGIHWYFSAKASRTICRVSCVLRPGTCTMFCPSSVWASGRYLQPSHCFWLVVVTCQGYVGQLESLRRGTFTVVIITIIILLLEKTQLPSIQHNYFTIQWNNRHQTRSSVVEDGCYITEPGIIWLVIVDEGENFHRVHLKMLQNIFEIVWMALSFGTAHQNYCPEKF